MPAVDTARAILSTLEDLGLTHVLYCPGSRSAPFAYALEAGAFGGDARPVLDERSAGFAAVGLARTGALPAIIVTSGTAVAELTPAVLEASHARLPLLVLSADRPGELRGVGASQATAQAGLFGVHARASIDLEPQEPSRSLVGQLSRSPPPSARLPERLAPSRSTSHSGIRSRRRGSALARSLTEDPRPIPQTRPRPRSFRAPPGCSPPASRPRAGRTS